MNSGVPWQVSGVTRQTRQAAREAARRAGMSVGEWLDSVIAQSAGPDAVDRQQPAPYSGDGEQAYSPERQYRGGETNARDRNVRDEGAREENRQRHEFRWGRRPSATAIPSSSPEKEHAEAVRRMAELEQTLPFAGEEPRPEVDKGFQDLHARLDDLARQQGEIAATTSVQRKEPESESGRELMAVVSKLDRRLDQLIAESRSSRQEIEQKVNAVGQAVADLQRGPAHVPAPRAPATPLEQALSEIADRQRALDENPSAPPAAGAGRAGSESLPRARTQELAGLEQQLRQINHQIEGLRPCGMQEAIDTLRDDLAEIGLMLQEAMPCKSVEALEHEMRKLTERIDASRNAGADGAALATIEHGLAEVRDALRELTPAANLAGVDNELHVLAQKVDALAHTSHDPAALHQLESAIAALRGTVSQVASNDALASLSDEVRALAGKVDRAAQPRDDEILNALEERIAALADALAARNQGGGSVPRELEAVIGGLVDKIERMQLAGSDHMAFGHLEDSIAKLVEKLDASDARLNQLEAIERGLAELLIHIEHQRSSPDTRAASTSTEVDVLSRDLAELRHTEERTQESLELVHGTLSHVVDRLAMIETDMRRSPAPERRSERPPAAAATSFTPPAPPLFRNIPDAFAPLEEAGFQVDERAAEHTAPKVEREASRSERRPIEPGLPPDHPLEPGSREGRPRGSPAERIAASESALIGIAAPPTAQPSSTSSFIAAARRAAQAASEESPVKRNVSPHKETTPRGGKLGAHIGKLRALLTGAVAFAIALGGLQIVRNFLSDPAETQVAAPGAPTDAAAPPAVPAQPAAPLPPAAPALPDAAKAEENAPERSEPAAPKKNPSGAETPPRRHSDVSPQESSITGPPSSLAAEPVPLSLPVAANPPPANPIASAPEATTSAAPAAEITGSIPPVAMAPKPPAAVPATPAPSPAERLPAVFAGALRTAAARNDAAAEYEIASRYAEGRGVPQDAVAAVEWFARAAKQGLAPAQFRLGGMYEKGLGVKKNLLTARRLYAAAGLAGNAKALHNLAVLYAEGIDGKPDYETAARWFGKAADYGIADSQYNLAVLYARGIGVEQNPTEAYRWFALAARNGDADAATKRDELAGHLDPQSLSAAEQAAEAWSPHKQPEAAVEVKAPPGGWGEAAATPVSAAQRKPMTPAPKLDLATPRIPQ